MKIGRVALVCALTAGLAGAVGWWASAQTRPVAAGITTVPGMPGVADATNLYSETVAAKLSPAVQGALPRVYVPNRRANTVSVIDPETLQVQRVVQRYARHDVHRWSVARHDGSVDEFDVDEHGLARDLPDRFRRLDR